jgi:nucleoside-diphosphate-sugar epimerase
MRGPGGFAVRLPGARSMGKQNIFLTGASGTLGKPVLRALAATGEFEVHCLARSAAAESLVASLGGLPVRGAMEDRGLFEELRDRRPYHHVLHIAQADSRRHSNEEIDRLDRAAVANLERLRSAATRLMVYTSGVWIFGAVGAGQRISESTPLNPFEAARGRASLVAELRQRTGDGWAPLCPPSVVYGAEGALRDAADRLRSGDIEVIDDPSVQWSVIEAGDLARAYLALLRRGRPGDFFVVAEDAPVGAIEFYESLASRLGSGRVTRKPRAHWEQSLPADAVERMYASQPVDSSRFKERTGWSAVESFASSVGRFL